MSLLAPSRVELKHAVPEALAIQALDWSRPFLEPDRGVPGVQRVTSLYLDSPELTFYRWHREGRTHRFKLRIRGYGEHPGDCVYAEVKERAGGVCRKSRVGVSGATLGRVLAGDEPVYGARPREAALSEFSARRRAYSAQPTVLVTCLREALRDAGAAGEVAITVDRRIVYQMTQRSDFQADPDRWRSLLLPARSGPAVAIMELKYIDQPPAWMATLLRHVAPYRVSFSKYAASVRQHATWSQW